jgi:hypothetical protein
MATACHSLVWQLQFVLKKTPLSQAAKHSEPPQASTNYREPSGLSKGIAEFADDLAPSRPEKRRNLKKDSKCYEKIHVGMLDPICGGATCMNCHCNNVLTS